MVNNEQDLVSKSALEHSSLLGGRVEGIGVGVVLFFALKLFDNLKGQPGTNKVR